MFCQNCGREMKAGEKFCGKCGTPIGELYQSTPTCDASVLPVNESATIDAYLAKTFIIATVCQVIMLVLRFVSFGKYHVAVADLGISDGGRYSINELMGSSVETALFVILITISIALCILPLIKNSPKKRQRMVLSKIVVIWNCFTVGMSIWALADCVTSNKNSIVYNFGEQYFTGSWSLTLGGWLNVIITAATVILLFKISNKTKNYSNK